MLHFRLLVPMTLLMVAVRPGWAGPPTKIDPKELNLDLGPIGHLH